MCQRRAVQSCTQRYAAAGHGLSHFLAVNTLHDEGQHPYLMAESVAPEQTDALGIAQQLHRLGRQTTFVGGDLLHTGALHITDTLQQTGNARHIVGPALQPVRQHIRHRLQLGKTTCTAV